MKDSRFIELVNLYIDRQITAEETAELEVEIQQNPKRRAIYRQYCQINSATKQVYDTFRANATEPQATESGDRVIRTHFKRRARLHWVHYAGGLTAAACLALVFARYNNHAGSQSVAQQSVAQVEAAPAVKVDVTQPPPVSVAAVSESVAPTLTASPAMLRNKLASEPDYAAMLAALRQDDQRAFANGQIQSGRPVSLFDDGVFAQPVVLPVNSQRSFRGRQAPDQQAEFTAFQFQR